jgi:hypothetical protein
MVAVLLAALLAGSPEEAAPAAEAPRATVPDPGAEAAAVRRGWRQSLALGWHGSTFWSNEGSHYTFHSLSVGYLVSFGPRGLFLHASGLVPLQARQDGRVVAVSDYYGSRFGGDVMLGWQWRWEPSRAVEIEAGPGVHLFYLSLGARGGFRDFSALPLGVGAVCVVRYRLDAHLRSWPIDVGVYASGSVDGYDPLRADDLRQGYALRTGLLVGLRSR